MRIALIGQPNSGKSTLFNQVAGYRAETGNFSGTTVTFTESKVRVRGEVVELVDLPGTYTLSGTNPAERETFCYLASHQVDVIINVVDASHLAQGLSLTMELLELSRPIVVAMNMMDEAASRGLTIDGPKLQRLLGVPILPLVASKGRGVRSLFVAAQQAVKNGNSPARPVFSRDVEQAIQAVRLSLNGQAAPLSPELGAIRLLEGDRALGERVGSTNPAITAMLIQTRQNIFQERGQQAEWVISAERHGMAANLAHAVVHQGERRTNWRDRLDDIFLHPVGGYLSLVIILLLLFQGIYRLGSILEQPLLAFFDSITLQVVAVLAPWPFLAELASGLMLGIAGGLAIVLPYLFPFLLGLSFLEDIGYLPRIAFLMDALMHRIGLHGKAVVPFILGYGCNVPAVMSTRMLEERRDRYLAATLATLVPCAARLAVVFGLVAFYLGPYAALGIYLFNLFVIALTGRVISKLIPEDSPGLILEMPVYRMPSLRAVLQKAWFRGREFIFEAWPALIIGSLIFSIMTYLNLEVIFNALLFPLSWLLGLPPQVGVPLVFGILRKELSLIMLRQALGFVDFGVALTPVQMITYTVFVVFYIPCLATLTVLKRELGRRDMLTIAGLTVLIATLAAIVARMIASLIY